MVGAGRKSFALAAVVLGVVLATLGCGGSSSEIRGPVMTVYASPT